MSSSQTKEDHLAQHAAPLPAATSKAEATKQLVANCVCRINGVVSAEKCSQLRDYLLDCLTLTEGDSGNSPIKRTPTILNTRLNCGPRTILGPLELSHRHIGPPRTPFDT